MSCQFIKTQLEVQPSSRFLSYSGQQQDRDDSDDEDNAYGEHNGRPGKAQRIFQEVSAKQLDTDAG